MIWWEPTGVAQVSFSYDVNNSSFSILSGWSLKFRQVDVLLVSVLFGLFIHYQCLERLLFILFKWINLDFNLDRLCALKGILKKTVINK